MQNPLKKIIDGRKLSDKILLKVRNSITRNNKTLGLAAIIVGDDPSSILYVNLKKSACEKCGIQFHRYHLNAETKEKDVVCAINFLNNDSGIDGIIVQLPLPKKFNTDKILSAISIEKDIDMLNPATTNKLRGGKIKRLPPLSAGIIKMLESTKERIENKNIVVLCNHEIFGKPFKHYYGENNTVHITTVKNKNYKQEILNADILIVTIGKARFIKKAMIKDGAIIIDVGINKLKGKITGDVDLGDVIDKVKFISPVPGGVGPMTIAMLLSNLSRLKNKKRPALS